MLEYVNETVEVEVAETSRNVVAGGELMSSPGVETARKTVVVSVLAGYVLEDVDEEVEAVEVEAEEAETSRNLGA